MSEAKQNEIKLAAERAKRYIWSQIGRTQESGWRMAE